MSPRPSYTPAPPTPTNTSLSPAAGPTPELDNSPRVSRGTTPGRRLFTMPGHTEDEMQPTVPKELRDFNKRGLKEAVIDVTGPRKTRSSSKQVDG